MKLFTDLARRSGLNQKAIERLLGSVRVPSGAPGAKDEVPFELGLGVVGILREQLLSRDPLPDQAIELLIKITKEYSGSCPAVFSWIGRGDFKPSRIPADLNRGRLQHACRTAGRLRARWIRSFKPKGTVLRRG